MTGKKMLNHREAARHIVPLDKRMIAGFVIVSLLVLVTPGAYALDTNAATTLNISVQQAFAIEFYTDSNVLYSSTVPFSNVDPTQSMVYADGRRVGDGKSDVGIICMSNAGVPWYLKIHVTSTEPLTADKVKYYVDQPYNRNTGGRADGTLAQPAKWYPFQLSPTTIYSSGAQDQNNPPFGTLFTFNYALDPSGLEAGKAYSAAITYTLTTAP
jgi:hypothetical protein